MLWYSNGTDNDGKSEKKKNDHDKIDGMRQEVYSLVKRCIME